VPLLAVLPGTGGLTRVTDKRRVRRDHADVFCTTEEGVKGRRAVEWRLVDAVVPNSRLEDAVAVKAREWAAGADGTLGGIALTPLAPGVSDSRRDYRYVAVVFDRDARLATIVLRGPADPPPASTDEMVARGASFWPLQLARELDDAILDIRFNELDVAAIVFKLEGDARAVLDHDAFLDAHAAHWLAREIRLKWRRVLKRIDLTARSLVALLEPGSCFAGTLAEIAFAADRSYMRIGTIDGDNRAPAAITLGAVNFGALTMCNGLSRHAAASARRSRPKRRRPPASSPSRSMNSTGRTKSASSWKSARASRRTASPASRPICGSLGPKPWKPRSSAASLLGRTGYSSAPTRSARKARCAATAAARSRNSI